MEDRKRTIRRAYDDIADEYLMQRSDEPPAARLLCDLRERLPAESGR